MSAAASPRSGFGWQGEELRERPGGTLVAAPRRDVYVWRVARSAIEIELIWVAPGEDTGVGAFYLGRFPVTFGQHRALSEAARRPFDPSFLLEPGDAVMHGPGLGAEIERRLASISQSPATFVSRSDAEACLAHVGLRLPSRSEWLLASLGPPALCEACSGNGTIRGFFGRHRLCEPCKGWGRVARKTPWKHGRDTGTSKGIRPTPVGARGADGLLDPSHPEDASPLGVMGLTASLREWCPDSIQGRPAALGGRSWLGFSPLEPSPFADGPSNEIGYRAALDA